MDRTAAIAAVTRLGAATSKPVVADVDAIVDGYAIVDMAGVAPNGAGWTPTYDVNGATAEVWRVKAGQVAGNFSFTADDATYNKGDLLAHMLAMETKYAAMSTTDRETRYGTASTLNVAGTNGPFVTLDQIAERVIP